jgi:hypothetical protein
MGQAIRTLRAVSPAEVSRTVESIPNEWEVSDRVRAALAEFICRRAEFVAGCIEGWIWPQREFDFTPGEGETP